MASVEGGAMSSPLWLMRTLTDPSDSFDVRKKAAEHANPNPDPKPNSNPKPKPKPKPNPNPNPSPSPKPTQAAENGYLAFADRGRPLRADDDGVGPSGQGVASLLEEPFVGTLEAGQYSGAEMEVKAADPHPDPEPNPNQAANSQFRKLKTKVGSLQRFETSIGCAEDFGPSNPNPNQDFGPVAFSTLAVQRWRPC